MIKNGEIRISDFGTSKYLLEGSESTSLKGTLNYAPPEFHHAYINNPNDKNIQTLKHDMFSLGIIAHQIFTEGKNPFQLEKSEQKIYSNITAGTYKINNDCIKKDSSLELIIKGKIVF